MKEVIKTAQTVDEAIELALKEMSLSREDVTCEVLEYPQKKLFFKKPAKVKVSQIVDEIDVKSIFSKQEEKTQEPKEEKQQPNKEVKKEEKPQAKQETKPQEEKVFVNAGDNEKLNYAVNFLKSIIGEFFKSEYTLTTAESEQGFVIEIDSENSGSLIGRKGETMQALSYLTSLAANRFCDDEVKISVDISNYRQKRKDALILQANKAAQKALKSKKVFTFEAMSAYDRRIIHSVISEIEGVKSESRGEGEARRVRVFPLDMPNRKPRYNQNNKFQNNKRSNNYQKPDSKPKEPKEKKIDDSSTSLYGKIEL